MSEEIKDEVTEEIPEGVVEVTGGTPEEEVIAEELSLEEMFDQALSAEEEEVPAEPTEVPAEPTEESTEVPAEVPVEPEEATEDEEVQLPEYTQNIEGEIDLTNQLEVDTINYWAGGPKADWTKHPEKMDDAQKEIFKRHQSAYDKAKVVPQKEEYKKNEMQQAVEDLARLIKGDPETKKKYMESTPTEEPLSTPPSDDDKMRKLAEAWEGDDRDAFINTLGSLLKETSERAVTEAKREATESAVQRVQETQTKEQYDKWVNTVKADHQRFVERDGSAYTQYTEKILGILELTEKGIPNPLTGGLVSSVEDAYALARRVDTGGEQRVASVRPSPAVAPPAGSNEGSGQDITDADMQLDSSSFMDKAWELALKNK